MNSRNIKLSELRAAICWYFEAKNLAIRNALRLCTPLSPVQQQELRLYYSDYFVNLVSAIELLRERSYEFRARFMEQLYANFSFHHFPNGEQNYSYLRVLRHCIVHRGINICSEAHACEKHLFVLAPSEVAEQDGKTVYVAPGKYLIEIISKCEETIGPLMQCHFEEVGLLKPLLSEAHAKEEAIRYLVNSASVPDFVKINGAKLLSQVNFVEMQMLEIEKMVELLNQNAVKDMDILHVFPALQDTPS